MNMYITQNPGLNRNVLHAEFVSNGSSVATLIGYKIREIISGLAIWKLQVQTPSYNHRTIDFVCMLI